MRASKRRRNTTTNLPFLPDRYEEVRYLGSGEFCTVYLVRHKSLDQERVLKIYPKDRFPSSSNLNEAMLLKDFRHPGIPCIYDLTDDTHNFYLVEEYVHGEPLDVFLLQQPIISLDFYCRLCEQLCDIFTYLHHFAPTPILYRDLKPEHILLCGMQVRLVDFGISTLAEAPGNNADHFGNRSFCAPENFTFTRISPSSDIYSLGKIMEYLAGHLEKKPSRPLRAIIRKATDPDPKLRYETAESLAEAIRTAKSQKNCTYLEQTIALIGSRHGCGTTHVAVSLVSTLNYLGISAVYHEINKSNSLRNAAEFQPFMWEKEGCFHYRFFQGIPAYGPGICISKPEARIFVYDYGCPDLSDDAFLQKLKDCDRIILVAPGGIWTLSETQQMLYQLQKLSLPFSLICNHSSPGQALYMAKLFRCRIYPYPADSNPFYVIRRKKKFFRRLCKDIFSGKDLRS